MLKKLLLFCSLAALIACTKATETKPPDKIVPQGKTIAIVFPHTTEFFKEHGQAYLQDRAQCANCHGPSSVAENPKTSCNLCHEVFPHPRNWAMKTEHAANYIRNPQACASCHGVDGSGGKSKVSCQTCHNYPHPKKWAVADNHGKTYVKAEDKSVCFGCHDPNKTDGYPPRCQGCHEAFPHTDNWYGDVGQPGHHSVAARTYGGKCLNCHREYKENMPQFGSYGGCQMCHAGKKIEIHWFDIAPPQDGGPKAGVPSSGVIQNPTTKTNKRIPSSDQKSTDRPGKYIQM